MIDRRIFLGTIAGGLLAAPLAAEAQQAAKVHRVGWLGLASPGPEVLRIVDAFRQGLREQGYMEGRDIAFEYRWAHGGAACRRDVTGKTESVDLASASPQPAGERQCLSGVAGRLVDPPRREVGHPRAQIAPTRR